MAGLEHSGLAPNSDGRGLLAMFRAALNVYHFLNHLPSAKPHCRSRLRQ